MVNKALLIAYHYPPVQVSSGVQRTLAFSKYLREYQWESVVLSAHPRAYETTSPGQLKDVPEGMVVKRAFALDTAKHLSLRGRYSSLMALPDRWISWWFGGVFSGLRLIRKHKPKVIWCTYPIATAHLIGYTLHRLTGIPLVADFRDSMTEDNYPQDPFRRRVFQWIERKVVNSCSKAVFTTPGAVRMYKERYPELPDSRWELIPNGYNEDIFAEVEAELAEFPRQVDDTKKRQVTLLHSGVVYPSERDPTCFFHALSELKSENKISGDTLKVVFRASGHDHIFQPIIEELNISDLVELKPSVSYREALKEILSVDGLLILQASNCNHQVPAKVYEYFRARKPVFSLTDIEGDTGAVLLEAGLSHIAPLDDEAVIKRSLISFLNSVGDDARIVVNEEVVSRYSRRSGAADLAKMFDHLHDFVRL